MLRKSYLDWDVHFSLAALNRHRAAQSWNECLRMEDDGGPAIDPVPLHLATMTMCSDILPHDLFVDIA